MLSKLIHFAVFVFLFANIGLAATFTVTKTADTADGVCNADCSLREAITAANLNGGGADSINFSIPGNGVKSIALTSELPEIRTSLTINGATQNGYFGKPLIEVSGEGVNSYGLIIKSPPGPVDSSVTIIALALNRHVYGVYSNCFQRCDITLLGNYIGTDPTGTIDLGNGRDGVHIEPADGSIITIGGSGALEGNVISGNGCDGCNYSFAGIGIEPAALESSYRGNATVNIVGNKIGTDFTGNSDLGNAEDGIYISERAELGANNAIILTVNIGGATAGARNTISGNGDHGIEIEATIATIIGNRIGVNDAGNTALGNGDDDSWSDNGIRLIANDFASYTVGGDAIGEGNVISGNTDSGVSVVTGYGGSGDTQLVLEGNNIGVNAAGTAALGNGGYGVTIENSTNYNVNARIGGATASKRNVISANGLDGLNVGSGTVAIYNNYIGTNADGTAAFGNGQNGVHVLSTAATTIGGTLIFNEIAYDAGNVISGNLLSGIRVDLSSTVPPIIKRNRIGTNPGGTGALGNLNHGILLMAAANVGSETHEVDGNIISGNVLNGILLNSTADQSKIFGNRIGTNGIGGSAIANGLSGILINNASQTQIGLALNPTAANIISGNGAHGIHIQGAGATGNRIENNLIGPGSIGNDLGNQANGVFIDGSASGNFIGSSSGTGNTIAFNVRGVSVFSGSDNEIRRNSIRSNDALGIDLDTVGVTPNDAGDGDTGGNSRQNFPVVTRATTGGIVGSLNSAPNADFVVDLYRNDGCDGSGNGEGQVHVGSALVSTDANGNGAFVFQATLPLGQMITSTATPFDINDADDTSEFSACTLITAAPTLSFSATGYSTNEGGGSRTIIVNRSGSTVGTVSVDYTTANGTATAGEDYNATSGTLTFGDGETLKSFNVSLLNDSTDEPDETVNLTLSNTSGGALLGSTAHSVLTITDNDNAPTVAIGDIAATEGNSGTTAFTFTVSLSAASGLPVSVQFATATGTADAADFGGLAGNLNFAPGETSKPVQIMVNGDTAPESDESFSVNLSGAVNSSIADGQGMGTIQNDDQATVTHSLRGTVLRANGTPLAGAAITLGGSQSSQTQTDGAGRFVFENVNGGGNYTVTAQSSAFRFAPAMRQFQNLGANVADADFTAIQRSPFDFDGDGKSDASIFRPGVGEWWYLRSSDGGNGAAQFGSATDRIVPGDWTGDGRTDIAFWRESSGTWFVLRSEDNSFYSFPFGTNGDVPVPADFNGDGLMDAAVFRPSTATWFIQPTNGSTMIMQFGASTDRPVTGDFDGDGKSEIAVFRPASGEWWIRNSSNGAVGVTQFGASGDRTVAVDYTGDGKTDIAFWRPSNGTWYVLRSDDGTYYSSPFGTAGDAPVTGDFDGDGRSDIGVFRPSTGVWYVNRTTAGMSIFGFGTNGDLPVPSAFVTN